MPDIRTIRLAAAAAIGLATLLAPAQTPPPQTPAAPPIAAAPAPPVIPPRPNELPPARPSVAFTGGMLSITASNSSLNQILRDISRATGIKITGGVADERVFGQYGPATTSQVLASLLDGTPSNMLFVHADASSPGELILTPRQGGPTPPNPNAASFEDEPEYHNPANVEENPFRPTQAPPPDADAADSAPAKPPASSTPATPDANQANPSQPNGTDGSNGANGANGTKTPQQIFEELQRLRQR